MRIRKPFAGAFLGICLVAALAGFSPQEYKLPTYKQSDKALHFVAFFFVTTAFYWILETSRRKVLQWTVTVCTIGLSISSEIIQGLLPNGRQFDIYDILANVMGSLSAVALCNWYHKRMLERKRAARGYAALGDDDDRDDVDIELGEGIGQQESGVTGTSMPHTVEEELENWDENAEDWDDTEHAGQSTTTQSGSVEDGVNVALSDTKKRND